MAPIYSRLGKNKIISNIECIYSSGVPFAGYGIGTIAYHAASGLFMEGMLKKLLCLCHKKKTGIPDDIIKDVIPGGRVTSFISRKIAILLGSFNGYGVQSIIYDNFSKRFIDRCDIFHCWAMESLKSLSIAKSRGAKFTILERSSSHILKQKEILQAEYIKYGIKNPIDAIEVERNIAAYEKSDYIIVPSDFAYKSFLESGFDVKKLIKIPYGYDPQLFKPALRKDNIFRALFCGNLTLRKGIAYLLEAWDRLNLKEAELVLVGHIFNEAKPLLKKYIARNNNVRIKNFLPYARMPAQYQQADIFIFPSLEEGSALVNYEAMACGLPIITTFNSGSFVRDGIDGFIVEPMDAEKLCEKLLYFYDNKTQRLQMGENARRQIENYTWEKYSQRLCAFYRGLNGGSI